jgi:hypothetical protein
MYPMSSQMYKCERGLTTAAERRAADVRAGEVAAALRDLRLGLGRALRLGHRVQPGPRVADAVTAPARILSASR